MAGTILVRPTGGLCNRLRVVSSFAVLARRSRRELQVCWTPGRGFSDERLEDLFENEFRHCTEGYFAFRSLTGLSIHTTSAAGGVGGADQAWRDCNRPPLARIFDVAAHPHVTYWGFEPAQKLMAPEDRFWRLPRFGRDFNAELRSWRPVSTIRSRVEELSAGFSKDTIGVHIRRGDAINHSILSHQYARSPDAAFMARMDRMVRSNPDLSFFLATDCYETEQRFRQRYGKRVLRNPQKRFVPSVEAAPKENQCDAVIDLFTLARTHLVLGTYFSTFSQTAATIGGARLKVAVEDSWLRRLGHRAAYVRQELRHSRLHERL